MQLCDIKIYNVKALFSPSSLLSHSLLRDNFWGEGGPSAFAGSKGAILCNFVI